MNINKKIFLSAMALIMAGGAAAQSSEKLLLSGWKFQLGNAENAQSANFDDSKWQNVTIPHDWAISGPFDKEIDKQVVAIVQNGEQEATEKTGRTGSLPWIGEGWYRTTISIPEGFSHAELIFDGAMAEPRVFVDGTEAGYWAYGYNTFMIDITNFLPRDRSVEGLLQPGEHTIAVHIQNVPGSSRWYPGAGLYRPVRLVLSNAVGIKTWGTFARTSAIKNIKGNSAEEARINISTEVRVDLPKSDGIVVAHKIIGEGQELASTKTWISDSKETNQSLVIKNPKLWSPENPYLYQLVTEVWQGDRLWDKKTEAIGIRSIEYGAEGFKLNGQQRKFKGVCLHHDLGPLGAAFNKDAFRRQVTLLKEIGCDAIRTSHNMPAPWQMEICDEMGMLVMAESCDMWIYPKCENGYAKFFKDWWERDFENLIKVHRNHPCIVMWSIGNEIPEQSSALGLEYTRKIQDLIHRLDNTRPCTQGLDRGDGAIWAGVFQESDVPGFNYRLHVYDKGHENSPNGTVLGTETCSTVSSRGVYKFPVEENHGDTYSDGQISSYDLESCIWSNLPDDDWVWQDKAPWVTGEFVWTGFDYLGEPTPYDEYWPSRSSYFGIYDLAGLPKDRAYLYRTHWAPEKNTLHVLPHWTFPGREGQVTPVFCYTSYPEAELFVNGKSQGRLKHIDISLDDYRENRIDVKMPWGDMSKFADPNAPDDKNRLNRYRLRWMNVKYEPGEIKVVAYDKNGKAVAEEVVKTAGKPHHIELSANSQKMAKTPTNDKGEALDCPSMVFVTAKVVDKDGNICPDADSQLSFSVSGLSAKFNSCCNGDATSVEVFTKPTMKAFHGQLVIVLEGTSKAGVSTLTVSSKGLKPAKVNVNVE